MSFKNAVLNTTVEARTENGMKALASSLSQNLDLFYKIGASRGMDLSAQFERAFQEDQDIALRVALWARDVRGGAGERQVFKFILSHLARFHPDVLRDTNYLTKVPELGRWDDLFAVFGHKDLESIVVGLIRDALAENNGLAAKWMPRKGSIAAHLRSLLGWTPKFYRKRLVELTHVVETQMCAKNWDAINFEHVPSLAMSRYTKAFHKNANERFVVFKTKLETGEAKINAGVVYPYDVIKQLRATNDKIIADSQWNALPDFMDDSDILPLVDVSGSMSSATVAGNPNLTAMDVALSLGLYCADKNKGAFKDMFLTFSEKPQIHVLKGKLSEKMVQLQRSQWDINTNLHAAFEEILRVATQNKVALKDMPKALLILSDMQFDLCCEYDDSALQMIQRKYEASGYVVPSIVFWNLSDRGADNMPVRFDERGTALVSGFSPSIMKSVLSVDVQGMTPDKILRETVGSDRYNYL